MKLYELPRRSYFYIDGDEDKNEFFLEHLDGMYSLCFNRFQDVIHLSAMAEVVQVKHLQPEYDEDTDLVNLSGLIGPEDNEYF